MAARQLRQHPGCPTCGNRHNHPTAAGAPQGFSIDWRARRLLCSCLGQPISGGCLTDRRTRAGFFDLRDREDAWIRVACRAGDMIVLPAGSFHRFTLDEGNYIRAMRLFVGAPVWTPINRGGDGGGESHPVRAAYLASLGNAVAA